MREPTPPLKGGARSALAGAAVVAASSLAAGYGPEAAEAAGALVQQVGIPLVSGLVLGLGTFVRKRLADWKDEE